MLVEQLSKEEVGRIESLFPTSNDPQRLIAMDVAIRLKRRDLELADPATAREGLRRLGSPHFEQYLKEIGLL
jgi:hypothetical protein